MKQERNLTTAYHPQANGLVERLHRLEGGVARPPREHQRQLDRSTAMGASWPEDSLQGGPSNDEPLTVPGDFVGTSTDSSDPALLLGQLREEVQQLQPVPTSQHGLEPTHVPEDIKTADYVFVRRDGHKGPLQRPYSGPYKVVESGDKTFRIDVGGREDTVK